MKIIYIYPALTTIGGADRVITDKSNYLADKYGYEVYIVTAHQNGYKPFFKLSDKVKHIDLDVNFNEQYAHGFLMRGCIYLKLLRLYKKRLSKLLKELKADFVLTTISRDIDFLHSIKDGSFKIAEAHVSKKYLRNLHLLQERSLPYRIVGYFWTKRLERAARKFDAFVVLTNNDAAHWKNIRKCTVIPNSIPFYPEETSTCTNKKVISVGRYYAQKGYDMLVEAWALLAKKFPDWTLSIYGDGELIDELGALIKNKGLTNNVFLEKPVTNIVDKYLESSIYVMSSRFEGFGMVLIEAMACGLPVVSFDCPDGPSDIISDGEDGFLVANGNIQELAEKLSILMEKEDRRIEMGQKARVNVQRYNQNVVMQKWVDLFEQLTNKKKFS